MKITIAIALLCAIALCAPSIAGDYRNARIIKKDMPAAGTYVALGVSSYVGAHLSALACYQDAPMFFSYSSDGSNPFRIPSGASYWDDNIVIEKEIYVTGTNNGDDAIAVISQ